MAPKAEKSKNSSAKQVTGSIQENTVLLGNGAKIRTLKLTNVENGKLMTPETSELKATRIDALAFTSASQHVNNFTLHKYRGYCHVDTVAAHLSKSKENKEKLHGKNLLLYTSTNEYLVVVKDLNDSSVTNVVSFNKACAIMAAGILKHTFDDEFDWTTKKYVKTENKNKVKPNPEIVNRLAGQMGLTSGNPYYWLIVPGYEFLYELYPAEVLAYTLVRLEHRKTLNIPDSMTDADVISSLVMKMNRLHKLEQTTFEDAIKVIGENNIRDAYIELVRDIGTTSKTKRNDEELISLREAYTDKSLDLTLIDTKTPRCVIDNETETCTLHLPKSCPLQSTISVQGNVKILKQLACLEACKELHHMGALTDNLVPDIVEEEAINKELECQIHTVEESKYFPPELVSHCGNDSEAVYYCYLVELEHESYNDFPLHGIILAVRKRLKFDDEILAFDLDVDRGRRLQVQVQLNYSKVVTLTSEEIRRCQRFQVSVFRILLDRDLSKLQGALAAAVQSPIGSAVSDYLLLPSLGSTPEINWKCVNSLLFPSHVLADKHMDCCFTQGSKRSVYTKTGVVCSCLLENSVVCTPHNGHIYCITGFLDNLDCNSLLDMRTGESFTYKEYYKKRHGIKICFEGEPLLRGKHICKVHNYLQRCRAQKAKDSTTDSSVELPPELCSLIMSPVSIFTLYTYSYVPSIMHRIESLVMASNLKRMHLDDCTLNVFIPTATVLEAMTTKKCLEKFHLESLETLGDSFLKYAASIHLFKTYENHHEGLLTVKKNKIISNAALCRFAIARKIPGFIRNEPFDLKTWLIPGDNSQVHKFDEEFLMLSVKMYSRGKLKIKSKRVADVVEALIGAYLSSGGEAAALSFMKWLGLDIGFVDTPMPRHFPMNAEKLVNVRYLESMLHYKFNDPSLLVEALTHGSYMLPEIPRCYQRLEFLGDAVLDYVVTAHLYFKYPGLTPGLITDLRSASVNNECYAHSAVKAGLHKHILHASQDLQRQIFGTVEDFEKLDLVSTFGWEAETTFPKVLGDVIESLAGAIFVDSSFNKDTTFQCIRPLLEPLITPQTIKLQPVRELSELCDQKGYIKKKNVVNRENGVAYITVEVEANGVVHKSTCSGRDKIMAKKVASKNVLKSLKECASNA